MSEQNAVRTTPVIDAYCHVGLPRFGSAEDAWTVLQSAADRAPARVEFARPAHTVFVLGPRMPDYATLFGALRSYGDRVRGIGIPFGETDEQVLASVGLQLKAGVLGLRVEPQPLLTQPDILTLLGEWGRWCYAIGAVSAPEVARSLLSWLERYPEARVAAPHFLSPGPLIAGKGHAEGVVRDLVSHPRFFPIFSRHGGVGSHCPYPHADLTPWVEQVIALAGWDRILWGSEYPVLFWRDETLAKCQQWLSALLNDLTREQREGYLGGNAARAIFDSPAPPLEPVTIPRWVEAQFARERVRPDRPVPLFPGALDVPMTVYAGLHHRYVAALRDNPELTFGHFVISILATDSPVEG